MRNISLGASWAPHVLAIELKKAVSYRLDFWISFFFGTATEIGVAYFLWKSIFEAQGVTTMNGFSFHAIVFYYLFASFSIRLARGSEYGYISRDIYEGGLTRYLLYPVSFLGYKYVTHIAQTLIGIFQFTVALATLTMIMGLPADQNISVGSICAGLLTCMIAGALHFAIASCLEMVAFWQDVIWNLMVMLRFIVGLLGGSLIPLAFFPEWGQRLAQHTPFPLLITFPVKTFLGQMTMTEWLTNICMISLWTIIFASIAVFIWNRGIKQYSGVGI